MKPKLCRSRKAVLSGFVLPLIIIAVGILAITVLWLQWADKTEESKDRTICNLDSFITQYTGKFKFDCGVNMDCDRRHLTIGLDDVEQRGRIDDDMVKNLLAVEMQKCWIDLGTKNPYGSCVESHKYCLVCTEISFDEDFQEEAKKENYELKGFHHYMAAKKPISMKTNLYEFVTGKRPSNTLLNTLGQYKDVQSSVFNMEDRLVVVWRVGGVTLPDQTRKQGRYFINIISRGGAYTTYRPSEERVNRANALKGSEGVMEFKEEADNFANDGFFFWNGVFYDYPFLSPMIGLGAETKATYTIHGTFADEKPTYHQVILTSERSLSDRNFCTRLVN